GPYVGELLGVNLPESAVPPSGRLGRCWAAPGTGSATTKPSGAYVALVRGLNPRLELGGGMRESLMLESKEGAALFIRQRCGLVCPVRRDSMQPSTCDGTAGDLDLISLQDGSDLVLVESVCSHPHNHGCGSETEDSARRRLGFRGRAGKFPVMRLRP